MQYGNEYKDREFALRRVFHIDAKMSLAPGTKGKLVAVDEPNALVMISFDMAERIQLDGTRYNAWVPEADVVLVDAPAPAEKAAQPTPPAAKGWLQKHEDKLIPIVSSNLAAIGFFLEDTDVSENADIPVADLVVKFKAGSAYRYQGIKREAFREFLTAESAGKYFAAKIKGLPFTKLTE